MFEVLGLDGVVLCLDVFLMLAHGCPLGEVCTVGRGGSVRSDCPPTERVIVAPDVGTMPTADVACETAVHNGVVASVHHRHRHKVMCVSERVPVLMHDVIAARDPPRLVDGVVVLPLRVDGGNGRRCASEACSACGDLAHIRDHFRVAENEHRCRARRGLVPERLSDGDVCGRLRGS